MTTRPGPVFPPVSSGKLADQLFIKPVRPSLAGLWVQIVGDVNDVGGVGGWAELERPRRAPAAEWVGLPARIQTIPIAIDGRGNTLARHRVVEADCRRLESWGVPAAATAEPPILQITGPVYGTDQRWVIDDLVKGTVILNGTGRRISQDYTLVLRHYLAPQIVRGPAARARATHGGRQ